MTKYILDFEKPIIELEQKVKELEELTDKGKLKLDSEILKLQTKADKLRTDIYSNLTRWQTVQLARHPQRPYTLDYIRLMVDDFVELHGDRNFRDDRAIVSGLGRISDVNIAIIGHQKGRGTKDNLFRNFGMPHPEGYRKALRVMKLAEKFNLPVVTLIDTPGAYPGLGAEERGQASAIAVNLYEMAKLKVPIVSVVIGEGGSGGALALGVADRVYMLNHSIYSVISPEGCASILYRDATKAELAAESLKLTAKDLLNLKLIDKIIEEPIGGAHTDVEQCVRNVHLNIVEAISELTKLPVDQLLSARVEKYQRMGQWNEN